MKKNRFGLARDIPKDVRQRVRRRCGFGCVICGSAIVTYEHFDPPYRDAPEHRPEGITLLCGSHQLESSKGLLSKYTIAQANARPICHQKGYASQLLDFGVNRPILSIGGTDVTQCGPGIAFDGKWLLRIRPPEAHSSRWRLSAMFNSADGTLACAIRNNELVVPAAPFEVEQVGRKLIVKHDSTLVLDLELEPPSRLLLNQYMIPLEQGVVFIGKRRIRHPISERLDDSSVLEFRHNSGGTVTLVDCAFQSDLGINLSLNNGRLSFSALAAI